MASEKQNHFNIKGAPRNLESEYQMIFTNGAKQFVAELLAEFDDKFEQVILNREIRRVNVIERKWKPALRLNKFGNWSIDEIPTRINNRKLDLGDISPANSTILTKAVYADVQGIQVDFDDGHCPTWSNTIKGIYNVTMAVSSIVAKEPNAIKKAPILWMRPRAFNMIEHNCLVNGKKVPGALFDFALLMYHNGKRLYENKIGPYLYLSKIEDPVETALWNEIFEWTQKRLSIPQGTIKVIVLIENILAAYAMEDILFSLRHHIIGLNCGIWDYSASIISKFGTNKDFLIPDRNKYVNVSKKFLRNYVRLVIATCHRHGALATGGMAAQILPPNVNHNDQKSNKMLNAVIAGKKAEINFGIDGFMVHDLQLVPHMNKLWEDTCGSKNNQMDKVPNIDDISELSLLEIPKGGVTIDGLKHNITVALLFIYHWFIGEGVFYYNGAVEDSATAEISRSQLWQWIRFSAAIEDDGVGRQNVTTDLVYKHVQSIEMDLQKKIGSNLQNSKLLRSSVFLLLEIVTSRSYIEYLTTFLNDNHKFRSTHNKNEGLVNKL